MSNVASKEEWEKLKEKEKLLNKALDILKVEEEDLLRVVERFQRK